MRYRESIVGALRECHVGAQAFCSICNVRSMFYGSLVFHDKLGELSELRVCDKCLPKLVTAVEKLEELHINSSYRSGSDAWHFYPHTDGKNKKGTNYTRSQLRDTSGGKYD